MAAYLCQNTDIIVTLSPPPVMTLQCIKILFKLNIWLSVNVRGRTTTSISRGMNKYVVVASCDRAPRDRVIGCLALATDWMAWTWCACAGLSVVPSR